MENLFKKRKERLSFFHMNRKKVIYQTTKKEIPDDVFKSCPACKETLPADSFIKNQYVCPKCNHHLKLSARERIHQIIDEKSFIEIKADMTTENIDFEGYEEKLKHYREITGMKEAVICGTGKIDGYKCAIAVMDSNFMMASMGSVVGEKITYTIEFAHRKKLPFVIFCASGGARMQEGIVSLMQMAKTSTALKRFSDDGLFYLSVLTNPTTGGVSASFAMLGDIILAEPDALIGFAGKRVIEKTINEKLPDEFQRAEFILEKGFVDRIVERKNLKKEISTLLSMHGGKC